MEAVADESDYIAAAMAKVMGGKGAGQEHQDGGGEGGAGGEADGGKPPVNIGPNVGGLRLCLFRLTTWTTACNLCCLCSMLVAAGVT